MVGTGSLDSLGLELMGGWPETASGPFPTTEMMSDKALQSILESKTAMLDCYG